MTATIPSCASRGAFIVLEGMDRSGKTTQAGLLYSQLQSQGHKVELLRFPDRTTAIGNMIDAYLRGATDLDDHAIHLLFSANRWEKAQHIARTLKSGTTIICDRYYLSGIIYTVAKQNPSLPYSWAHQPEVGLPLPDLTLFLDVTPEGAEARGGFGEERYERKAMQAKVRKLFAESQVVRIDAGQTMDVVRECIAEKVDGLIDSLRRGAFENLRKVEALTEEQVKYWEESQKNL